VSDIFGNDWLQLVEQRVDMERKFLEHSLLRSESSTGVKVPWNESSWTFRYPGANVARNESSTGAKVLSMVFSLPGTKVQRNEKASYRFALWTFRHQDVSPPGRFAPGRFGTLDVLPTHWTFRPRLWTFRPRQWGLFAPACKL